MLVSGIDFCLSGRCWSKIVIFSLGRVLSGQGRLLSVFITLGQIGAMRGGCVRNG